MCCISSYIITCYHISSCVFIYYCIIYIYIYIVICYHTLSYIYIIICYHILPYTIIIITYTYILPQILTYISSHVIIYIYIYVIILSYCLTLYYLILYQTIIYIYSIHFAWHASNISVSAPSAAETSPTAWLCEVGQELQVQCGAQIVWVGHEHVLHSLRIKQQGFSWPGGEFGWWI